MIPIVLFQSLWMFILWLVFTSNLISQTTWLKVKLKLVNLLSRKCRSLLAVWRQELVQGGLNRLPLAGTWLIVYLAPTSDRFEVYK